MTLLQDREGYGHKLNMPQLDFAETEAVKLRTYLPRLVF